MAQAMMQKPDAHPQLNLRGWHVIDYVRPKLAGTQHLAFSFDWQRNIPWIRVHISAHQCPSLLRCPRRIAFPAIW
jgi:hypothetical protein